MSIRLQLNVLIAAIIASFLIAIGIYLVLGRTSEALTIEKENLQALSSSLERLRLDIAMTTSLPLKAHRERIKTS
jgi:hypothetical protein